MNYENYENKLSYPIKPWFTKYKIITVDQTSDELNYDEFKTIQNEFRKNKVEFLVKEICDEKGYKLAQEEYSKENQRIEDLFCQDLKDYYGDFDDYPNSDKLFSEVYGKAYEDGHGSGRRSVAEAYGELYDFVRQILKLTEKNG